MFVDRREAGERLAEALLGFASEDPVVLGLPRGGVPVAAEVASALHAPLDVLVVRKLGCPWQPELGFGAIGEGGVRVVNAPLIGMLNISQEQPGPDRRPRGERGCSPGAPVPGGIDHPSESRAGPCGITSRWLPSQLLVADAAASSSTPATTLSLPVARSIRRRLPRLVVPARSRKTSASRAMRSHGRSPHRTRRGMMVRRGPLSGDGPPLGGPPHRANPRADSGFRRIHRNSDPVDTDVAGRQRGRLRTSLRRRCVRPDPDTRLTRTRCRSCT